VHRLNLRNGFGDRAGAGLPDVSGDEGDVVLKLPVEGFACNGSIPPAQPEGPVGSVIGLPMGAHGGFGGGEPVGWGFSVPEGHGERIKARFEGDGILLGGLPGACAVDRQSRIRIDNGGCVHWRGVGVIHGAACCTNCIDGSAG
jgi:hypothetical protein